MESRPAVNYAMLQNYIGKMVSVIGKVLNVSLLKDIRFTKCPTLAICRLYSYAASSISKFRELSFLILGTGAEEFLE